MGHLSRKEGEKAIKTKQNIKKRLFRGILLFSVGVFLFFLVLFVFFNLPGQTVRQDILLGITFSHRQAESLGLNWKETYIALLDDMGVREIRIPIYWDLVERESGIYDWTDVDWQLAEAEKRGARIILTVGQRVPRWPECHIPEWAKKDDALRKEKLLVFVENVVERYGGHPEIEMWQVENEAFLPFFGICPELDVAVLDREIALVRSLDPIRPILMSDSGELSAWISAADRGDVFGTTMYRDIYKPEVGYFRYPIGPNFFRFKEWITRLITDQENFYVIELQGEPWGPGWIGHMPLSEQFKTMNETRLRDTVQYAQRVGFPRIYLWGAEWWYWLREKQAYPAVWNEAKKLFNEYGKRDRDTVAISFGNKGVNARVADDEKERSLGLSRSQPLGKDEGMVFIFPKSERYGFWMKEMKYPIDIVWMDEQKRVVHMEKCVDPGTYPKVFTPDAEARYVLEVSCGWIDRNDIRRGSSALW